MLPEMKIIYRQVLFMVTKQLNPSWFQGQEHVDELSETKLSLHIK